MNTKTLARVTGGCALALFLASSYAVLRAQIPQQSCGNEGEAPCGITLTNAVCDTGLQLSLPKTCGCLLRGFFGNCLIPKLCLSCINYTRKLPEVDAFPTFWVDWALRNQRELAQDEPLNWVMHLGTHNSFNSVADGNNLLPNQIYSMTDQLRAGARLLTLDLYHLIGAPRLCHSFDPALAPVNCSLPGNLLIYPRPPGLRYYANGIKEIRNWLAANPREIIFLNLENYVFDMDEAVPNGVVEDVLDPLKVYLGKLLFDPPIPGVEGTPGPPLVKDTAGAIDARWPTRREMLAAGRRVIVIDNSAKTVPRVFGQNEHLGSFTDGWFAKNLTPFYPNCSRFAFTADAATNVFTFQIGKDYTPIADGDQVVLKSALNLQNSLPTGVAADTPYYVINAGAFTPFVGYKSFQLATAANGSPIDLTDDYFCREENDDPVAFRKLSMTCGLLAKAPVASAKLFSIVVEERESGALLFGQLNGQGVAAAAQCNTGLIVLDQLLGAPDAGLARHEAAVWSWKAGDRGQHGACAMVEGSSGRWASAACGATQRFACAKPRSEAGLDPLDWADQLGEDWKITAGSGPWDAGQATCAAEFTGYNFSVPVNGYQNQKLKDVNTSARNLWLNYSQREKAGRWLIGRLPTVDAPPIAEAGPDQAIECGLNATLNGSASTDPQGDPLTYVWSGPFGTLSGQRGHGDAATRRARDHAHRE